MDRAISRNRHQYFRRDFLSPSGPVTYREILKLRRLWAAGQISPAALPNGAVAGV